jgi:hypothetical protein
MSWDFRNPERSMTKGFSAQYPEIDRLSTLAGIPLAVVHSNYSGEHIAHLEVGRPLFVRSPESRFMLLNFMRVHLFCSLGALRIGNK